jgi:rubrerythrin
MSDDIEASITALKTAIEIEIQGYDTFIKFSEQTRNDAGKRVFAQLAKDEKRHREILEEQLNKQLDGQPWEEVDIPKSVVEEIAPQIREKAIETKGEDAIGELDALNTALDLEKKASAFFREQADKTDIAEAKSLFLRLAEWEDTHYDLIKAEIDNINHTGFWLDFQEFKMDGMY